ncbi:hypothetical protein N007_17140 [Alicyclobacillus acidoterrestris ATCC 49025]|nr:hypothetical protein N007_17140 [Alicyclobacillus acidoterrestris ATCC 49025]
MMRKLVHKKSMSARWYGRFFTMENLPFLYLEYLIRVGAWGWDDLVQPMLEALQHDFLWHKITK